MKVICILGSLLVFHSAIAGAKIPHDFHGKWASDCKTATWDGESGDTGVTINENSISWYGTSIKDAKWVTKGKKLSVSLESCEEGNCEKRKEIWEFLSSNTLSITDNLTNVSNYSRCK